MNRRSLLKTCIAPALVSLAGAQSASRKTRNVILVTSDGLRWQDVFRGADPALLATIEKPARTRELFWRETEQGRRQALMPFLWSEIARAGQLYGNRDKGSESFVTNGRNFSYPGYSELLAGHPDDRIDSNDKKNNPNTTVLEALNRLPAFKNRVAAFGAWDVFPYIINAERSGVPVYAGYDPLRLTPSNPRVELLNRLKSETGIWDSEALDAPMFHTALEYLQLRKPRVLYIALGDTDEWAHAGRYDLYLSAVHRADRYLSELWSTVQKMPEYRGNTTLMVAVDHGRGAGPDTWRSHGAKIPDSKYTWFGILGPDTPALGERSAIAPVNQTQIAPTLAALLGQDYQALNPKAGSPIADAIAGASSAASR